MSVTAPPLHLYLVRTTQSPSRSIVLWAPDDGTALREGRAELGRAVRVHRTMVDDAPVVQPPLPFA